MDIHDRRERLQSITVQEAWSTSLPFPRPGSFLDGYGVRVPEMEVRLETGQPVLAMFGLGIFHQPVYILVTREDRGYLFNRYSFQAELLYHAGEPLGLDEGQLREIEEFLEYLK